MTCIEHCFLLATTTRPVVHLSNYQGRIPTFFRPKKRDVLPIKKYIPLLGFRPIDTLTQS